MELDGHCYDCISPIAYLASSMFEKWAIGKRSKQLRYCCPVPSRTKVHRRRAFAKKGGARGRPFFEFDC